MVNRNFLLTMFIALALVACGSEEPVAPIQPGTPSAGAGAAGAGVAIPPTGSAAGTPVGGATQGIGAAGAAGAVGNTITIGPGFSPDPITIDGTGGGQVSAASWTSNQCRGFATAMNAPMILVNVTGMIPNANFLAASNDDSTLIVQKPDGSYLCGDDEGGGLNPRVSTMLMPGQYKVWVGAYSAGSLQFRFGVSATATQAAALGLPGGPAGMPQNGAGQAGIGGSSPTQPITVQPGFMPDPTVVSASVNATVDASSMGPGCYGYVGAAPTALLTAQGNFSFLRIMAAANSDTVLVVRSPSGQTWCNDDALGELNSAHEGAISAGVYQVYAGFLSSQSGPVRVGVTELRHVKPSQM